MRKRQRKKNHKKFIQWLDVFFKEKAPELKQMQAELEATCKWRGHDFIDNGYVGIPGLVGKVCKCCGLEIPNAAFGGEKREALS